MCVDISIIDDSVDEQDQECFAFIITTAMEGVSLETTQSTICITDDDGMHNPVRVYRKKRPIVTRIVIMQPTRQEA